MPNFNLPTITSLYTDVLTLINSKIESVSKMFDGTSDSNIPTGAKKYDSSSNKFQQWNGSAWADIEIRNNVIGYETLARTTRPLVSTIQDGQVLHGGTSGGSANAQTITMSPAITAYTTNQRLNFKAGFTNTSTTTINVNSLGTKTIKKYIGNAKYDLTQGDIRSSRFYDIQYDGTDFILLNPVGARTLLRSTSGTSLSNSTTATKVVDYTVKANTLGAYGALRFRGMGDVLNFATGAARNLTITVAYGTNTIFSRTISVSETTGVPSSAAFEIEGVLSAHNSTSSQRASIFTRFTEAVGGNGANLGTAYPASGFHCTDIGVAEDSTADKNLTVTLTLGVANANFQFNFYNFFIEEL